jgi:hypothetical protein
VVAILISKQAVLIFFLALLFFKVALMFYWTYSLHTAHREKYEFWKIFRMMFAPQNEQNLDPQFWKQLQPIQNWNVVSNIIFVFTAALLALVS